MTYIVGSAFLIELLCYVQYFTIALLMFLSFLDQRQLILESERRKQSTSFIRSSVNILKEVFLPRGFPNSVSKDYTEYQIWDTIQVTY